MKHECNVARDLMPLALDGAASEESQKLLDEHLVECSACKEYYGGMRAALPLAHASSEQDEKAFDTATRKLRKKRRFRLWRRLLIGVLIGIIVTGGAFWGWTRLTSDLNVPMYYGNYNVFLSQLKDGSVAFNMDFYGSSRVMGVQNEEKQENGKQILYVYNETSRIPRYMQTPNQNYSFLTVETMDDLDEIRQGVPDEYAVVWKAGESIPPASAEMEAYFALLNQDLGIRLFDDDSRMRTITYEETQLRNEFNEKLFFLKAVVPEWQ